MDALSKAWRELLDAKRAKSEAGSANYKAIVAETTAAEVLAVATRKESLLFSAWQRARVRVDISVKSLYQAGPGSELVSAANVILGGPEKFNRDGAMYVYVNAAGVSQVAQLQELSREYELAKQEGQVALNNYNTATAAATAAARRLELATLRVVKAERVHRILSKQGMPAQTQIGPDGCPSAVPEGSLRDGSEELGIKKICRQAVRNAATPQAAVAIKQALLWLGAPYACEGVGRLNPFRFDCSSYVARAYWVSSGIPVAGQSWAPTTRNMMPWGGVKLDPHYAFVPVKDIRPGDLLLYRSCTQEPCAYQHVVMFLGQINGKIWQAHTNSCGSIAHVSLSDGFGDDFVVARRVIPLPGDPPMKIKKRELKKDFGKKERGSR